MLAAWQELVEDIPGLGLLNVTSPDLLHRDWSARRAARWTGSRAASSHIEDLLAVLSPGAGLVTVIDGSPGALSWLGGVKGMRVSPLGVDRFGQSSDLIYFDQDTIRDPLVDTALQSFGVGHEQIVPHELDFVTYFVSQFFPSGPVILGASVFDGADWVVVHPIGEEVDHLVAGQLFAIDCVFFCFLVVELGG